MRKLLSLLAVVFFIGCKKNIDQPFDNKPAGEEQAVASKAARSSRYTTYTIQQGAHYCDQNSIKSVRTSEMRFMVKFDNSAIYQTVIPENQYDINKLWGFTEGLNNQYNSARIGWSWNDGALRLYGYVYANGVRYSQEITPVEIGSEIACSIKLAGNTYLFSVNGTSISLPRGPSTTQASGYQQYPYFGGDEVAPHLITILIKGI